MTTTIVPRRRQRSRAKGARLPAGTICVTRPGRFGNHCRIEERRRSGTWAVMTIPKPSGFSLTLFERPTRREAQLKAVGRFRCHAELMRGMDDPDFLAALVALRGHDLACWCALCPAHADGLPLGVTCLDCDPCHADVWLEFANVPEESAP